MNIDLDGFDRVWNRVMGDDRCCDECRGNDSKRLRGFMDSKREAAGVYEHLARHSTSPKNRRIFMTLAREERQHLKMLQSAYFLLTGDSYRPKRPKPVRGGSLSLIRRMYNYETDSAEAFRRACQETKIPNLAGLFKSISADDAKNAQILEKMIRNLMR